AEASRVGGAQVLPGYESCRAGVPDWREVRHRTKVKLLSSVPSENVSGRGAGPRENRGLWAQPAAQPHQCIQEGKMSSLENYYKEHADQARQHENQRERMTNIMLAVGGILVGFVTYSKLSLLSLPAALLVLVLGVFG